MDILSTILGAVGSVASIVSLLFYWKGDKKIVKVLMFVVVITTGAATIFSYKYYQSSQPDRIRKEKMDSLRSAIRSYIYGNKLSSNYWNSGDNEGIINSGLAILEINKELFPDTYAKIKSDIESDLKFSQQHRDSGDERYAVSKAANNIVMTLKALSGTGEK